MNRIIVQYPKTFLAITAVVSVVLAFLARNVTLDPSIERLVATDNSAARTLEELHETFATDEPIVIAFEDPELFTVEGLERLKQLTDELSGIEEVISAVSLTNVNKIIGAQFDLLTGPLIPVIPKHPESLKTIRAQAASDPLIEGIYFKAGSGAVAIRTEVGGDDIHPARRYQAVQKIREVISRYDSRLKIAMAGIPVLKVAIAGSIARDLSLFVPVVGAVTAILLLFIFRSIQGMLLPITAVMLSCIHTLGFMAFFNTPLSVVTVLIFPLILVVGTATTIHVLAQYYEDTYYEEDQITTVSHTLGHMLMPCFLTTLTTSVGLFALATSNVQPIREAGIFASIGLFSAYFLAVVFIPAALLYLPRPPRPRGKTPEPLLGSLLTNVGRLNVNHPKKIVIAGVAVGLVSIAGLMRLEIRTDPMSFFPDSHPLPGQVAAVESAFGGTTDLQVVLRSDPDYFSTPEGLDLIETISAQVTALDGIDKVISLADYAKRIISELRGTEVAELPHDELVLREAFFLYGRTLEGDDLLAYATQDFSKARLVAWTRTESTEDMAALVEKVRTIVDKEIPGAVTADLSGSAPLYSHMVELLVNGQILSIFLALAVIFIIMAVVLYTPSAAALCVLPNALPLLMTYGLMGVIGVPLSIGTALIGAVALGIAVDDTVHLISRYRRELEKDGDYEASWHRTLQGTGRAITYTTIVLTAGLLSVSLSEFALSVQYGLLAAFAMICAWFADVLVLPSLILLVKPKLPVGEFRWYRP